MNVLVFALHMNVLVFARSELINVIEDLSNLWISLPQSYPHCHHHVPGLLQTSAIMAFQSSRRQFSWCAHCWEILFFLRSYSDCLCILYIVFLCFWYHSSLALFICLCGGLIWFPLPPLCFSPTRLPPMTSSCQSLWTIWELPPQPRPPSLQHRPLQTRTAFSTLSTQNLCLQLWQPRDVKWLQPLWDNHCSWVQTASSSFCHQISTRSQQMSPWGPLRWESTPRTKLCGLANYIG